MKSNFFVRALYTAFIFTIFGFSLLAVTLDFGLLPSTSRFSAVPIENASFSAEFSRQLHLHQVAASSYQQALPQLRNHALTPSVAAAAAPDIQPQQKQRQRQNSFTQALSERWSSREPQREQQIVEEQIAEERLFDKEIAKVQSSKKQTTEAGAEFSETSPITAIPLAANLKRSKASPYAVIEAALDSEGAYPVSFAAPTFTRPAFVPPKFAQRIPQTLGQIRDRAKEQPVKIIEASRKIRPALERRLNSAETEFQQIPNAIKSRLGDALDRVGEKAHEAAEDLRTP